MSSRWPLYCIFLSMVHLDNSPQPHVRTYFDFCREVFLFAVRFFYLPWGFSICREVSLFAVRFFYLPWGFSFCRETFTFAVSLFLLPWGFSFCRESFSFCREVFRFAVSLFFLPWVFFFLPWSYFFCRESFSFAVRFSFSPWGYFFCRDSCGPPYFWVIREINSLFRSKTQWQMFLLVSGRHVGAHVHGWRLHTNLYKFGENVSSHMFHAKNFCDLNLGEGLCICTFFLFPDSGLNLLNGFDFLFWSILNGVTLKTSNWTLVSAENLQLWQNSATKIIFLKIEKQHFLSCECMKVLCNFQSGKATQERMILERYLHSSKERSFRPEGIHRVLSVIHELVYTIIHEHIQLRERDLAGQENLKLQFSNESDDTLYRYCGAALQRMIVKKHWLRRKTALSFPPNENQLWKENLKS